MTNEESINTLNQNIMQGMHGSFFFLSWVMRRRSEKKRMKSLTATDDLLSDACSRYRGGYYSPASERLTADMMVDLTGGKTPEAAPFIFLGNRSDLSIFWQVVKPGRRSPIGIGSSREQRVFVPRTMLDEIPDETIRQKTIAAFSKARADGLLHFDGRCYNLTDVGKHNILKSDFVVDRLKKEYEFFCTADTVLGQMAEDLESSEKNEWIDKQLQRLGIDPERYAGCRRITIDRKTLEAEHIGDGWIMYIPHTSRQQMVTFPEENIVEATEKTLIGFIRPGQFYSGGNNGRISAEELMWYFDDKTKKQTRHPSVDAIQKAAEKEPFAPASWKDPTVDAKLKVGETVFAPDQFQNSLELHQYRIDRVLEDPNGKIWYKLSGDGLPDQILPEDALGKFMFTDQAQGQTYLSAHGKEAADYADELLAQTMGEQITGQESKTTYTLTIDQKNLIAEGGDACRVKVPGKQVEQMIVPKADVVQDGSKLQITLHSDQRYKVVTGAYGYDVSGDGLADLSGAKVQRAPAPAETTKQTLDASLPRDPVPAETTAPKVVSAPRAIPEEKNEYLLILEKNAVHIEPNLKYSVKPPENPMNVEKIIIPKQSVKQEGDQMLITLQRDQSYFALKDGHMGFVSGRETAELFGSAARPAITQTSAAAASTTAASTAATTAATAATSTTAQTAVNTTVAAIPVPEPVTMATKTLYAAVAQAATQTAQTAAQSAAQSAPKLVQTIGKEG